MIIKFVNNKEGIAEKLAANLGRSDRAEFAATGNTDRVEDVIQYGLDNTQCYILEDNEGKMLCLGGIDPANGTLWLLTTTHAEGLNRKGRLTAAFKLRGVLNEILTAHRGVKFQNVVSMSNKSHIRLIKALGGKGFNTILINSKTSQMFYPFYFIKE